MKIVILLFSVLLSGCVVSVKNQTQTYNLETVTTKEGISTYALLKDSIFIFDLEKETAIYSCLSFGKFFLMPSADSVKDEMLFFEDTILGLTRPFPVLGGWSGWNENVLNIIPNIQTRTLFVILDIRLDSDSKKKTRVVRTYEIDQFGRPIPKNQVFLKHGRKYIGDT